MAAGMALVVLVVVGKVVQYGNSGAQTANGKNSAFEGLPQNSAEVNSRYAEPLSGKNAAAYFSQGFEAMSAGIGNVWQIPPLGAHLTTHMKSAVAAAIESNRNALHFFEEGSKCEGSRYAVDVSRGFDCALPHLTKVKGAMQLIELNAILHCERHEAKGAASSVMMSWALMRTLQAEPMLPSQLMRVQHQALAMSTLEQVLNRITLPSESLDELFGALKKMVELDENGTSFNFALASERASWLDVVGSPQQVLKMLTLPGVELSAADRKDIAERAESKKAMRAESQFIERALGQLIIARKAPYPGRLNSENVLRTLVGEAGNKKLPVSKFLLLGLLPALSKECIGVAQMRLAVTAIALEQYRAAHENRYPAALSDLQPDKVKEEIVDPFDGQTIRYRPDGDGYVLYSIGPDLKDDSGLPMRGKDGDIVFTLVQASK